MSFQRFDDDDPRECLARLSSARTMQNIFMNNKGWTHNNNNKSRKKLFMPFLHRHPLLRGKNYSRRKLLIFTRHFHSNSVETTQNNFVVCSWSGGGSKNYTFFNEHHQRFCCCWCFSVEPKEPFFVAVAFRLLPHNNRRKENLFVSLLCNH